MYFSLPALPDMQIDDDDDDIGQSMSANRKKANVYVPG